MVDAEYVLLGIEQNRLVPIVIRAVGWLHEPRPRRYRAGDQPVDFGAAFDIDVEKELHARRRGMIGKVEQFVGVMCIEADATAPGIQPDEYRRADRLDLAIIQYHAVETAHRHQD